ncbi:hypothetical protein SAMN05446635_2401 [Burkholderia sp. OK233]|nr:hypothetical protein SAMN05446635_2401 [Burkholderia sp. OK233]
MSRSHDSYAPCDQLSFRRASSQTAFGWWRKQSSLAGGQSRFISKPAFTGPVI